MLVTDVVAGHPAGDFLGADHSLPRFVGKTLEHNVPLLLNRSVVGPSASCAPPAETRREPRKSPARTSRAPWRFPPAAPRSVRGAGAGRPPLGARPVDRCCPPLRPVRPLLNRSWCQPKLTPWLLSTQVDTDGLAIGSLGFFGPPDSAGAVTIGYGLIPDARGAGYATEALRKLLEFARSQDVRTVRADTT